MNGENTQDEDIWDIDAAPRNAENEVEFPFRLDPQDMSEEADARPLLDFMDAELQKLQEMHRSVARLARDSKQMKGQRFSRATRVLNGLSDSVSRVMDRLDAQTEQMTDMESVAVLSYFAEHEHLFDGACLSDKVDDLDARAEKVLRDYNSGQLQAAALILSLSDEAGLRDAMQATSKSSVHDFIEDLMRNPPRAVYDNEYSNE